MELLGAEVRPVRSGSRTLKDAVNEAMRDWVATSTTRTTASARSWDRTRSRSWCASSSGSSATRPASSAGVLLDGGDPDVVVACVGGGSNAAGTFAGFVDTAARLVGVEAAGGAAIGSGIPGVLHGMRSQLLQDEAGQILEAHSISAGLDYPGIGPEHAHLAAIGRADYEQADDDEVLAAFKLLAVTEGIIPALEPAHAVAWVVREARGERCRRVDRARHAVGPR